MAKFLDMRKQPFQNPGVAAKFAAYPKDIRSRLLSLRQLIFDVAAKTAGVGPVEETLKWGQPSYLTTQSKSGSLIRIDQLRSPAQGYAMYFHCQTTLVDSFKEMFPRQFTFGGNRSLLFNAADKLPVNALRHCIAMALAYHLQKIVKPAKRVKPNGTQ